MCICLWFCPVRETLDLLLLDHSESFSETACRCGFEKSRWSKCTVEIKEHSIIVFPSFLSLFALTVRHIK